ncbi:MAG: ATP synthase F1 subunit gamma [Planctomycetota bacterium]|nr:ATP synthase F1 subunit gamma [Planctomycetota bacterium]
MPDGGIRPVRRRPGQERRDLEMANARLFLKRRKAIQSTRKITRTMELVATARLQRTQAAALRARPYATHLSETVAELVEAAGENAVRHPLLERRERMAAATVVILTADRGMCGSFNSNILRRAQELLDRLEASGTRVNVVCAGRKGLATLKWRGVPVAESYTGISDKPDYAAARKIAGKLTGDYVADRIDGAFLVFSRFESVSRQVPCVEQLLPLEMILSSGCGGALGRAAEGTLAAEDAVSGRRRTVEGYQARPPVPVGGFMYHPSPARILDGILPLWVETSVFAAMLENAAGEQAARRLAMKNATDNADEMIALLTRRYNRARQGKITQEIAEIVGGAEAL